MRHSFHVLINWCVEFGPILTFFTVLFAHGETPEGFIRATGLFVLLTILALLVAYVKDRRVALFPLIAGAFIVGFGLFTLLFKNPVIFIVKDTFYNGMFALLLFVGVAQGRGLLKPLFGSLFDMTERGWYILSFRWAIMFFLLMLSNEIVWRHFSEQVWIVYKFIATIATVVFGIYQITLARRERGPKASLWGLKVHGSEDDPPPVLVS